MAISRNKKEEVLQTLREALQEAGSGVFVNFHGLSVAEAQELRRTLAAEGVRYRVVKKTIMRKALEEAGVAGERPAFEGEFGFAWGEDLIAPARGVYAFAKGHKEHLAMLGGIFEGGYKNAAEMQDIALIPSREILIAQVLQLINSPISGLAVAMGQIAQKKASN